MGINIDGAGGVEPGTLYAMGEGPRFISRYRPNGEFAGGWSLTEPFKFCGPGGTPCPSRPSHGPVEGGGGIAVDQTTGNVYVLRTVNPGFPRIIVFSANGSEVIARFGIRAAGGETIATSPEKIHDPFPSALAVDDNGTVYVADWDSVSIQYRLMVFEPESPGDYEHYVYAGQDHDFATKATGLGFIPKAPVTDAAGDVYVMNEDGSIAKLDPTDPSAPPLCEFKSKKSGIKSMAVNPETGEVFFYAEADQRVHQLSPCGEDGKFTELQSLAVAPKRNSLTAMAVNPTYSFGPGRPPGVLYAGSIDGQGGKTAGTFPNLEVESAIGYVFAPPLELLPEVISESATEITFSSARLQATLNPKGAPTRYAFQYLDEGSYQGNDPDERQSLAISAGDGVFGLGFEGRRFGGAGRGTLTSGSATVEALATAAGTGTLSAAAGTGTLNGAAGKGTLISGSATISAVNPTSGSFAVGQEIHADGIPDETTIVSIAPEEAPLSTVEITISKPATKSVAHAGLSSGTTIVTSLTTSEGTFEPGQILAATPGGIASGTEIKEVKAGELVLSRPVLGPKAGVTLQAGSTTVSAVVASIGSFEPGRAIGGEGIAPGTKITAVGAGKLTISEPATKAGTGVALADPGPYPLAVGETIEGAGIPDGTTIVAAKAGQLTLSNTATASGAAVLLQAGLPVDVSASRLRRALEDLPTIGAGGVEVDGGPGDETGSNPYLISFTGAFENKDVPELELDGSGLDGSAAVTTEHQGGDGFANGAAEAPAGGAIAEGSAPLPVAIAISGLQPGTAYRYRLIATSNCAPAEPTKTCPAIGPTRAFVTYAPQAHGLPDDRAYELVSPPAKQGGQVFPAEPGVSSCKPLNCKPGVSLRYFAMQSATDGNAVSYEGTPFSFSEGAKLENAYVARRDGVSGWHTTTLSPSQADSKGGGGYRAYDPSLSAAIVEQRGIALTPDAPPGYTNLYRQSTSNPLAITPFLTQAPPNSGVFSLSFAAASTDLSRVFFEANDALTPDAQGGPEKKVNLYESAAGQLHLVNLAPGGGETLPGSFFGSGTLLESGDPNRPTPVVTNAVSDDGARAFWTDEGGHLYARVDGAETLQIPDPGLCSKSLPLSARVCFLTASTDGSRVLLSDGKLFALDEAAGAFEPIADLSQGQGGFLGIAGQSDDLSHVYFVDTAVLTGSEENGEGDVAAPAKPNLYSWTGGTTTFVATLLPQVNRFSAWAPFLGVREAQASPAGRYLAFGSTQPLTGFDNTGPCQIVSGTSKYNSSPCPEVFLFDSATGELDCPSCGRAGVSPHGPAVLPRIQDIDGLIPQPRYLTDSGRLYFDSQDSLSPFDTNGRTEDVYQFEPGGVGDCEREGGCVSLLSAGRGEADSNFLVADPTGENVFFTTRDRLLPADVDGLYDLYDARAGGGIAEPQPPAECQGESCQPPISPPDDPTPGSSSHQGPGNVDEGSAKPGCRKGKVRRHGKCVKKQKAKKQQKHRQRQANHDRRGDR